MVPFGEILMFFKFGSTESKFTQEDLIIDKITPLFNIRKRLKIIPVVNPEPRRFEGVKGYIANNGANITPGFYRNYNFITDNMNTNLHIHQVQIPSFYTKCNNHCKMSNCFQINPNLNQLFIDQYRFWTIFRDSKNGLYCDSMHTEVNVDILKIDKM